MLVRGGVPQVGTHCPSRVGGRRMEACCTRASEGTTEAGCKQATRLASCAQRMHCQAWAALRLARSLGDKGWNTTDVTSTLHSVSMGTNGGARKLRQHHSLIHVWEASRFTKRATAQFLNRAASAPASNSARDIGRLVR
jgi:hypothetical protein